MLSGSDDTNHTLFKHIKKKLYQICTEFNMQDLRFNIRVESLNYHNAHKNVCVCVCLQFNFLQFMYDP